MYKKTYNFSIKQYFFPKQKKEPSLIFRNDDPIGFYALRTLVAGAAIEKSCKQ